MIKTLPVPHEDNRLFPLESLAVWIRAAGLSLCPVSSSRSAAKGERGPFFTEPAVLVQPEQEPRAASLHMAEHRTPWRPGLRRTKMRSRSPRVPWLSASSTRGLKRQKLCERKRLEEQPLYWEDKCGISSAFLSSVLSLRPVRGCSQERKWID